jgi:plasmid stabilization system protein ParE
MEYEIIMTDEAESDLNHYVSYLVYSKKNLQAASSLIDDFEITKNLLKTVAESLKLCDNPRLKELGYRRINFVTHRYFILYRVVGKSVFIDSIFHELEDYENKLN